MIADSWLKQQTHGYRQRHADTRRHTKTHADTDEQTPLPSTAHLVNNSGTNAKANGLLKAEQHSLA